MFQGVNLQKLNPSKNFQLYCIVNICMKFEKLIYYKSYPPQAIVPNEAHLLKQKAN